jgi:hypothetical protein
MLKGKLTVAGAMVVEGEMLNGVFIECSTDELRNNIVMLYSDVEVSAAKSSGAQPPQADNSAMLEIALCLKRLFNIVNQGGQGRYCDLESEINAVVAQLQQ